MEVSSRLRAVDVSFMRLRVTATVTVCVLIWKEKKENFHRSVDFLPWNERNVKKTLKMKRNL